MSEDIKIYNDEIRIGNKIIFGVDKNLSDYITNLQEENEKLKDFNNKLQATKDRLDKYDKENTILIKDYKSRCENAIVILNNIYLLDNVSITNNAVEEIDRAINILQGVDKE